MKYLSLFSGIGAFEKALDRLNINYELVGYSDIDKYASKSYSAIHKVPESLNFGDITKINEKELPNDIDLITYGFPCQDISCIGKQNGLFNKDGSQTRSGLFFEALRIIKQTQPKVAIAENVKNLTSSKFSEQFKIVLESLEQAGYNNYYKILDSKNYGIPQSRERVFIVSIRKDIDTKKFIFPEGFPLESLSKDLLENYVDSSFYISNEKYKTLIDIATKNKKHNENELKKIGNPNIQNIAELKKIDSIVCEQRCDEGIRFFKNSICGTLRTIDACGDKRVIEIFEDSTHERFSTIRKITPKEAFRMMAFDDEDFVKVQFLMNHTQLFKQAGNSIVVNVPFYIFKELFKAEIL